MIGIAEGQDILWHMPQQYVGDILKTKTSETSNAAALDTTQLSFHGALSLHSPGY